MTSESQQPTVISLEQDGEVITVETTIPRHPGWKARLHLARQGGSWAIASAQALPHGWPTGGAGAADDVPPGGITAAVMRSIPLADAPRLISQRGGADHPTVADLLGRLYDEATVAELPRAGRQRRDDSYYASWALLYVEALESGSRRPNADIAARFEGFEASHIRDLIHEASRRDLITAPTRRGTALGRTLTPKAIEILNQRGETS